MILQLPPVLGSVRLLAVVLIIQILFHMIAKYISLTTHPVLTTWHPLTAQPYLLVSAWEVIILNISLPITVKFTGFRVQGLLTISTIMTVQMWSLPQSIYPIILRLKWLFLTTN